MRFHFPLNMEFISLKKASDEYCFGKSRDFSHNGLSFVSKDFDCLCETDNLIMIKFEMLKDNTHIYALADIKWKKKIEDKYLVGVKIRRVDQESRNKKLDFPFNIWTDDKIDCY